MSNQQVVNASFYGSQSNVIRLTDHITNRFPFADEPVTEFEAGANGYKDTVHVTLEGPFPSVTRILTHIADKYPLVDVATVERGETSSTIVFMVSMLGTAELEKVSADG